MFVLANKISIYCLLQQTKKHNFDRFDFCIKFLKHTNYTNFTDWGWISRSGTQRSRRDFFKHQSHFPHVPKSFFLHFHQVPFFPFPKSFLRICPVYPDPLKGEEQFFNVLPFLNTTINYKP
jgi:hypothetical protein